MWLLICWYLFIPEYVCDLQLQAHFLVLDDIIDGSVSRRGRPCWYLYENLGTAAINDGLLLGQGLYQLLSRYFRDKPYYARVLELFHDVSLIFISKIRVDWTVDLGITSKNGIKKEVQRTVIVKQKLVREVDAKGGLLRDVEFCCKRSDIFEQFWNFMHSSSYSTFTVIVRTFSNYIYHLFQGLANNCLA